MNKNIMCVCASGDTVDIGFYNVDVIDNQIGEIWFENWNIASDIKTNEAASVIINLYKGYDCHAIIIDSKGRGIEIISEIEKYRDLSIPIYKARPDLPTISNGIVKLQDYISNNNLVVNNRLNVDLSKFGFAKITPNGMLTLDVRENKKEFNNITILFTFIEDCVLGNEKKNNRIIIEKNLREILEILVKDLCNADKSNPATVNELTRLIDKVNYIRNQY